MKCAVVLLVNNFRELDELYGFDYTFRSLANSGLSEPFYVLIADGFKRLPWRFVSRWKAERIHIVDASTVVETLLADYPYLRELAAKRTFRITFLRHLILERFFSGEAVLSADLDIVWRVDPYRLFGAWREGFFAWAGSGFLTYDDSPEWFQTYRTGLESVIRGGELTADFAQPKFGITRILHDQHLIQHLCAKGLMKNEWLKCWSLAELRDLCMMANPLLPKTGFREPPGGVAFRREGGREYFNDAFVPFWHMATGFCSFASFLYVAEALAKDKGGRLPFPVARMGEDNLKSTLFHALRSLIAAKKISEKALKELRPLMFRSGLYPKFFEGDLPHRLFTDRVWWEPNVFP